MPLTDPSVLKRGYGDRMRYSVTHAAIYIGNSKIIHARTPAHGIGINSVYIMKRLHIRRVIK